MPSTVSTGTPSWPKLRIPFLALPAGGLVLRRRFSSTIWQAHHPLKPGHPARGPAWPVVVFYSFAASPSKSSQCPVELCFSYLDDAVLAGEAHAVAAALRVFQAEAAAAGLVLEPSKVWAGSCCRGCFHCGFVSIPSLFFGQASCCLWASGLACGDADHCNTVTLTERVGKAAACLEALAALDDPQVSLLLLRHCSSFTKLVHSMRTTPAALHHSALQAFDEQIKCCLEQIGCFPVADRVWQQATLGVKQGGLGLRQCAFHAPAAYLASVAATQEACRGLDARYTPDWPSSNQSAASYNAVVLDADRLTGARALRQQDLSAAIDKAQLAQLTVSAPDESTRAHLQLVQQPGAGAWLFARPSKVLGLHLDAAFFRVALRMRLRVPVASTDGYCPLCDGIADRYGDHARACPCGGDRTKRHNRLRGSWLPGLPLPGRAQKWKSKGFSPTDQRNLGPVNLVGHPFPSGALQMCICLHGGPTGRQLWTWQPPVACVAACWQPRPLMVLLPPSTTRAASAVTTSQSSSVQDRACSLCPWLLKPVAEVGALLPWTPGRNLALSMLPTLDWATVKGFSNFCRPWPLLCSGKMRVPSSDARLVLQMAWLPWSTHSTLCAASGSLSQACSSFGLLLVWVGAGVELQSWRAFDICWWPFLCCLCRPMSRTGHGFFQLIFHPTPAWSSISCQNTSAISHLFRGRPAFFSCWQP